MKLKTLLIIGLLISTSARAQFEYQTISARGNAMGGCFATLNDYWSNVSNIAGAANINHIGIGLAFRQNYIINNQSYKSLAITLPTGEIGTTITTYTHYGNTTYNEQKLAIGYAMHISNYITLGITIDYLHSDVNNTHYQSLNAFTFDAGLQIYPTNKLIIGANIFNPINIAIQTNIAYHIPCLINIGISYQLFKNFLCSIEFNKNIYHPATLNIGLEYNINQFLQARIGFSTYTQIIGFGIGWKNKHYAIDLSSQIHPSLGISPQISAYYLF